MRRLAGDADVSVRTIYNLFGDKTGVITALAHESLDAIDVAVEDIAAADPLERIWEAVTISVDATIRYVPRAVMATIVSSPGLYLELSARWRGRELTREAIRAATRAGMLRDDLSPDLLVEQAGTVFLHLLGRWGAGDLDGDALRAGALRAFDVCLLAVARPPARARLLAHAATLDGSPPHPPER
jgi:AcrR family transcriptional regulator